EREEQRDVDRFDPLARRVDPRAFSRSRRRSRRPWIPFHPDGLEHELRFRAGMVAPEAINAVLVVTLVLALRNVNLLACLSEEIAGLLRLQRMVRVLHVVDPMSA